MTEYNTKVANGETPDFRIKEALLFIVGSLEQEISRNVQMRDNMEQMLKSHVASELTGNVSFLKARACWMYGIFYDIKFADEAHVKATVDGLYKNLFSEDLPVRLEAALALTKFLENKIAEEALKPVLKTLLEKYLTMMDEIDSEELVAALENLMGVFADDIGPFAVEIVQKLVTQY
jgi:hypothetical protein